MKLSAAACIIAAGIAPTRIAQAAYLDYQVKNMTAELKDSKMKMICVGRFLIDVPADAVVSYRGAAIAGWDVATFNDESDEQFAARLEKKEAELAGKKNRLGMPNLEATHQVDQNGVSGKIHVFARERIANVPPDIAETVRVEAMIRAQKHSFNLTRKFGNDGHINKLELLVSQFRFRGENEIPTEPGFCIDGGFIVDPLPFKPGERITMFVGLNGHPDVSIILDMTAGISSPQTLLQRQAKSSIQAENSSRFHTFRSGPRPFNGADGEEVLKRVHEYNGNYGHSFMWEPIHNKTDSVFTPDMSFEMSTGHGKPGETVNASLTDAAALALWDKMLSSLRVRPVQKAKPVTVAPTAVSLGTWAYANERCPQTGWWECTDGDNGIAIQGGRQQYYRKGEDMAQAVQLIPTTLAQRLSGQQPSFTSEIPTPWKLVNRRQSPRSTPAVSLAPAASTPADGSASAESLLPDSEHDETTLPPGTAVDSGMVCPASGWWRCVDADALDGTRWFGRGQHVPLATVRQQLSTLARFKGALEVTHQKASWQFVRHDARAGINSADNVADDESADKPT